MAERRMFAKTIIDSDAFLDMPLSAQSLYFHLSMRADDDGFINNPKKVQRTIGASEDDLKLLIAKRFIIPFESGIVVIKHWKIHNYIRGDRKKDTVYPEEMAMLETKENGAYTLTASVPQIEGKTETARQKAYSESSLPYSFDYKIRHAFWGKPCPVCGKIMSSNYLCEPTIQHNNPISKGGKHDLGNISVICRGCNVSIKDNPTDKLNADEVITVWDDICRSNDSQVSGACQADVSIGKDRLRIGKDIDIYVRIRDAFNDICKSYPKVTRLTDSRKKKLDARLREFSEDDIILSFHKAEESDFLSGRNDKWKNGSFDWIVDSEKHMLRILEGVYDDKETDKYEAAKRKIHDMFEVT